MAGPSDKEKQQVAVLRAHFSAAKKVFERRKARVTENRRMLAGLSAHGTGTTASSASAVAETAAVADAYGDTDRTHTNLYLRAQMGLKSQVDQGKWAVSCSNFGDLPEDLVDENESLHEKLAQASEVAREFSDATDDGGTIGVMAIWYGVDRLAVNHEKQAGSSVPIDELVASAAMGDPDVHPLPGMDFVALAKAARGYTANPLETMKRTIVQLDNLTRLAQEADQMWADEMEKEPAGYDYGTIRTRRLVYGDDLLWDARTTTRWQDAKRVFILKSFTVEEAQSEDSFKPSARKLLTGSPISTEDGAMAVVSMELSGSDVDSLNKEVLVVEAWCKDTGELHYFTESGGYDGFLERDSRYPYFDANGRSVLKDWYPIRACTPVVNNLRVPERTLGMPWLEQGRDHAKAYNLFDTALTASRKKCGRVVEYPAGMTEVKAAIESGADLVTVERPQELDESKPLIFIHDFKEAPVDLEAGKNSALQSFARCVDMSVEEISGISVAPTLGQSQAAASGTRQSRGGLIRKLERFAGEIVRDLGALARLRYTDGQVSVLMGPAFTLRRPAPTMGPDGMPILDAMGQPVPMMNPQTGEPVLMPSVWDIFKGSGFEGDEVEVEFSKADKDLMERKAEDDTIALMASPAGINPLTGLPYYDARPVWERIFKTRGLGRPKPLDVPPQVPPQDGEEGAGDKPGEGKSGENREAPGGGRTDGRAAGGTRGPPPVPGRQSRGQNRDVGDASTKVNRTGVA